MKWPRRFDRISNAGIVGRSLAYLLREESFSQMVERVKAGRLNLEFSDEPQLLDQIFVTGRQINLARKRKTPLFLGPRKFVEFGEQARCCRGWVHVPHHDLFVRRTAGTVQFRIAFLIGPERRTIESNSCKNSSGTRVSQNLCLHLGVCIGGRGSSNRSSRNRSISAERELAREKFLGPALIHDEHDGISF
jgi:hypothetical protein